jgi:hypothetical protein
MKQLRERLNQGAAPGQVGPARARGDADVKDDRT